jgi:dienelactone hydrolase
MMHSPLLPALLLAFSATAAVAAPPPVEAFFGDPAISLVTLSPKGNYVAFMHVTAEGKQVIGIRDTRDPEKYTVPAKSDTDNAVIESIHWINENRLGFTVKDRRVDFIGNVDEFAADRDGSNTTHLISGNWRHRQGATGSHLQSRVLTAAYAYHGGTHDGSDDIVVEKYQWNNVDMSPESSRLYRLNTRTRTLTDLLPGTQPGQVRKWIRDLDGKPRIAVSQRQGRCIVSYREPDGATWTEIDNNDCLDGGAIEPAFFDGSGKLYVHASDRGRDALYTFDVARRHRSAEPIVSIDGFDFDGGPEIDFAAKKVVGLHYRSDAGATVWFDPAMKAVQQKVDALLPNTVNRIACGEDCRNSAALLVTSVGDRAPPRYYLYTPATGKIVGLGSSLPDLKAADLGQRDLQRIKARDGLEIPVYVTMPPGAPKGPHPTVVLVHGGPYVRGTSWEFDEEAQFLASRGYVVLQPEFRGTTGYGFAHFRAGWRQWGKSMQDDLVDAAQWAVARGITDPKRVAIMGASYGGYATLMGLIKHPDVFRCGVDFAGAVDIGMLFTVVQSDASQEALKYDMKTLLGDPDADAAALAEVSPLAQAARLKQPVLIAHGAEDRRVPLVHAARMKRALAEHNRAVDYVVYPEEGHGLALRADRIDFYRRVEAFLAKNLR